VGVQGSGCGRARGAGQAGFGREPRKEAGGSIRKKIIFYFSTKTAQKCYFEQVKAFSKLDPKTKVVQNFILYHIALGYILKFQLDFEMGI
jgi:hypothetical protein